MSISFCCIILTESILYDILYHGIAVMNQNYDAYSMAQDFLCIVKFFTGQKKEKVQFIVYFFPACFYRRI